MVRLVIGLGGNLGAGKTTLAKIFQKWGAKIIEADKIGWSLLKPTSPVYRKIIKTFGESILTRNRLVDRKRLANLVFAHPKRLSNLNRIIHPYLIAKIRAMIRKSKGIVILDAALLFNWGLQKELDASILVCAPKKIKLKRVRKLGMSKKEAERRLSCQLNERAMAKKADFVIKNNSTKQALLRKAKLLWRLFNHWCGQ